MPLTKNEKRIADVLQRLLAYDAQIERENQYQICECEQLVEPIKLLEELGYHEPWKVQK